MIYYMVIGISTENRNSLARIAASHVYYYAVQSVKGLKSYCKVKRNKFSAWHSVVDNA